MKTFSIKDPVYGAGIFVFADATAHDLDKWATKNIGRSMFPPEWKCKAGGVMTLISESAGSTLFIVWFKEKSPDIQTIVHEAFHLASMVLQNAGVEFDDANQEAYAYYLDFLTGCLLRKLPTDKIGVE